MKNAQYSNALGLLAVIDDMAGVFDTASRGLIFSPLPANRWVLNQQITKRLDLVYIEICRFAPHIRSVYWSISIRSERAKMEKRTLDNGHLSLAPQPPSLSDLGKYISLGNSTGLAGIYGLNQRLHSDLILTLFKLKERQSSLYQLACTVVRTIFDPGSNKAIDFWREVQMQSCHDALLHKRIRSWT